MRGVVARAAILTLLLALLVPGRPAFAAAPPAPSPDLALSLSLDLAGGGPDRFATTRLIDVLFGARAAPEEARLRARLGSARYAAFTRTLDYAVPHAIALLAAANVPLPDEPVPPSDDGRALAAALDRAGTTAHGRFDADALFGVLLPRDVHRTLSADLARRLGPQGNVVLQNALTLVMADLRTLYHLNAA